MHLVVSLNRLFTAVSPDVRARLVRDFVGISMNVRNAIDRAESGGPERVERIFGCVVHVTATKVVQIEASGLKEIIRIKVTFDAGDSSAVGIHFLVQAPTWRPY